MHYLKGSLTGEASKLVQHLQTTEENYDTAWQLLTDRYDNKRLIMSTLLNKLILQPSCSQGSAAGLKKIHDTTKESLLAIGNLGVPTNEWSPIIVHMLLQKIDPETQRLFEQSLSAHKEMPALDDLLHFLNNRFQLLESIGKRERTEHRSTASDHSKRYAHTAGRDSSQCGICRKNHRITDCGIFFKMSTSQRRDRVKDLQLCFNCLKGNHSASLCSSGSCRKCNQRHHTMLHIAPDHMRDSASKPILATAAGKSVNNKSAANLSASSIQEGDTNYVFLATALVNTVNNHGGRIQSRALLDSGSQLNFISEELYKRLNLAANIEHLDLSGVGNQRTKIHRKVNLKIQARNNGYSAQIEAFVLPSITSQQPNLFIDITGWPIPRNIELADKRFNYPNKIDLLLGAELYCELMSVGQIEISPHLPRLQNTMLGWIVLGAANNIHKRAPFCGVSTWKQLDTQLEKFWVLEEPQSTSKAISPREQKCEEIFESTTTRGIDGKFIVKLPFMHSPANLGRSEEIAKRRFLSLERRLHKDQGLRAEYGKFIHEYLALDHMELVPRCKLSAVHYFLPHHCVLKPSSTTTKLRVVFDASAKTSSNVSLNELLHVGPAIQEDLFSILTRFRLHRYVITADIEKMYRQILIAEEDQQFQLVLWRDSPKDEIQTYKLKTVTYGTAPASYLSTKCLHLLASENHLNHPNSSKAIREDFYVDDLMTGASSIKGAIKLRRQISSILEAGGFHLRKWCSNHADILKGIPREDLEFQVDIKDGFDGSIKALGLSWLPSTDTFIFKTTWPEVRKVTKRTILADTAHLFDPLGLVNPVVVRAKILLQQIWKLKLDWDAALPMELHTQWLKLRQDLLELSAVSIPRFALSKAYVSTQIHAFSDASERAYGAAIYLRTTDDNGSTAIRLLCAKSRVAPLKTTSLARLELCAAQVAALLVDRIKGSINTTINDTYYWTDSEIVLSWLKSESSSYNTFVANRVASIQQVSDIKKWSHVSTKYNPADLVSRGASPKQLVESELWFEGPAFLRLPEGEWISKEDISPDPELERKTNKFTLTIIKEDPHFIRSVDHRNSFRWLQRVIGYILRFIQKVKLNREKGVNGTDNKSLSVKELEEALIVITRHIQQEHFSDECAKLQKKNPVSPSSKLSSLNPFTDEGGVIRVGGRLTSSHLSYESKYPILLPNKDIVTLLLMTQLHKDNLHAGPQALLAITRQRFWPMNGRKLASSVVRRCVICAKMKPKILSQLMGDLPPVRVQSARPFYNAGVDFCGPIATHFKIRGKHPQKSYIAVFCCFVTKAVHLELVSDLSAAGFLGALRRFISRRGRCQNLYCDNATNFVGARNKMQELAHIFEKESTKEEIVRTCTGKGIQFHFIPPRAPHFGGLWEAAVKSAKHLLLRTMTSASLTFEELSTLIAEVEAVLNSRPLTPMSSNPNDLAALTPGHFLIGESMTAIPDSAEEENTNLVVRWKRVAHVKREFWRRWTNEYLCELQHRNKWKTPIQNVQPGMMVIIKDDNLPPLKWQLGRIVNVIPGEDTMVRVVDVKTASGVLRRPVARLAPLPVDKEALTLDSAQTQPFNTATELKHSTVPPNEAGSNEKKGIRNRKTLKKTSLLSIVLLVMVVTPAWCIKAHEPVETTQLGDHPGIYFEGLGQTSMVADDWTLVVYYDLHGYFDEFRSLRQIVNKLQGFCNLTASFIGSCEDILSQLNHQIEIIETGNKILTDNGGETRRQRRGLFNVIGNIAHGLFGILNEDYAEKMARTIQNVNNNEVRLLDVIKNQTSIIEVTENIIKQNQAQVKAQFDQMDEQISQVVSLLGYLRGELVAQRAMQTFVALALRTILITNNHIRVQDALCDLITDLHHGKINPVLLNPSQLEMALSNISANLPASLVVPAVQGQSRLATMYKLMTAQFRLSGPLLMFKIKIPLTKNEHFELFKLIPLPTPHNKTFVYIEPSTKLLVVNLHRDYYYEMTEQEFSQCVSMQEDYHLCKQNRPFFHKENNKCELSLLNHEENLPLTCKLREVAPSAFWYQLHNRNAWIFSLDRAYTLNIVCNNVVHQKTISEQGILKFNDNCMLKQGHVILSSYNVYKSEISSSFIPSFNISERIYNIMKVNSTNLKITPHNYTEESLSQLDNALHDIKQNEKLSVKKDTNETHLFTIAYIAFSCVMLIMILLTSTYVKKFAQRKKISTSKEEPSNQSTPKNHARKQPVPARRGVISDLDFEPIVI